MNRRITFQYWNGVIGPAPTRFGYDDIGNTRKQSNNDPTLAATHPHHKHVPPDIKHNRIPAPGLSFTLPNLPVLIDEIEQQFLA
jgi:hypothetical protein